MSKSGYATVGQSMRNARLAKGITQRLLAKKAGVSYNTIYQCERDMFYPSLITLISVADVLDISLDDLVGRKYSPTKIKERPTNGKAD